MSSSTLYLTFVAFCCFYEASGVNNGEKADIADFKYVVGIRVETLLDEQYTCTGGIISPRFILTAAHCFTDPTEQEKQYPPRVYRRSLVRVYAGTKSLLKLSRRAIRKKATDIFFLKSHLKHGLDDVAVVKLSSDLVLKRNIAQVNLPEPYSTYSFGTQAKFAGFGIDQYAKEKAGFVASLFDEFTGRLKKLYIKTVPTSQCGKIQGLISLSKFQSEFERKFFCTFSYREDWGKSEEPLGASSGDSGSPVVLIDPNRIQNPVEELVIGVVTRGSLNGDSRSNADVHANIAYYMDKLIQPVMAKDFDPKNYTDIAWEPTLFNHCSPNPETSLIKSIE